MVHNWASATYFCQIAEAVLALLVLFLAFYAPHMGTRRLAAVERLLAQLANDPKLATLLIIVVVVVGRLVLLPFIPVPEPAVHDEFSYLLGAETFAAGRLTNQTHPFWQHFESVHILQHPTYMSMYPPGQGLFLGAGIWATGFAWGGVVLSVALLCGVLFWALRGWFPSQWALVVTLLAVVRWGIPSYWMNSYWGGAVPALGGALVFGSIPRLVRRARSRDAIALGMGLALLAATRPYEGLVVSATLLVIALVWARREGCLQQLFKPRVTVPLLTILVGAAGGLLFYNARVTGDPFLLPYLKDRQEYAITPLFVWRHTRDPEPRYNTEALRKVYVAEVLQYRAARAGWGIPEALRKGKNIWIFFFAPLLSIPFVGFLVSRGETDEDVAKKRRYISIVLLVTVAALLQATWFYPHYASPAFAAFLAMLLIGFQKVRRFRWRGRPAGIFLSRAVPLGCVLMAAIPISAHRLGWQLSYWPLQWAIGAQAQVHPRSLESSILASGKKALVFVEYGPNHDVGYEWVYNAADIDQAPIVWAREISPESDAALMRYFRDRSVWIVNPDQHPILLRRIYLAPKTEPGRAQSVSTVPEIRATPTRP